MRGCGLKLHPEKTKIVYCKDDDRRRTYPNENFDFLGYRPGRTKNRKKKYFINFSPPVSDTPASHLDKDCRCSKAPWLHRHYPASSLLGPSRHRLVFHRFPG